MTLRTANIRNLNAATFDVLIVGGGINGAACAAALAAQGCSVAIVDRGDFGGLTSQASSHLIWGGIKYLENFEFPLVWHLCGSRNRLIRAYPANIMEIRFYAAIPKKFRWPPWMLYLATWLYWVMGRFFTRVPRLLTPGRIRREEPAIRAERFAGGVEYSDAYLVENDSRFVFGFVRAALNSGAVAANYVEFLGARRGNDYWYASLRDVLDNRAFAARARIIINAAGPLVDEVNAASRVRTSYRHLFSKGVHLTLPRLTEARRVLTFFDQAGRMFFVIPAGPCSVVGTTDTFVSRPETAVTAEDRRYLLDAVNACLRLDRPLDERDIISQRCGVRPLVVARGTVIEDTEWFALSRRHVIEAGERWLSIFGGKLTDCLNVGDEAIGIVERMGVRMSGERHRWYGEPPRATREEFFRQARLMRLDSLRESSTGERISTRLWRRYGMRGFTMLEDIRRDPSMGEVLIEGAEYLRVELHVAARSEMVTQLDDFLRRRSRIALIIPFGVLAQSPGVFEACRILFGEEAQARYEEYFSRGARAAC